MQHLTTAILPVWFVHVQPVDFSEDFVRCWLLISCWWLWGRFAYNHINMTQHIKYTSQPILFHQANSFWHAPWLFDPQELRSNQQWNYRGYGSRSWHGLWSKRGHLTMQNVTRTGTTALEQRHTIAIGHTHLDTSICNRAGGYFVHPEYSCYTLSCRLFLQHFPMWC